MKKMKWLWSYPIDKTEQWLADMANKGYHLHDFNATTRVFTFEQGKPKTISYAIRLAKNALPSALVQAGWQVAASSKRWQFLKNEKVDIAAYPSREAIVKRSRLHTYLWLLLSIFLVIGQLNVLLTTTILLPIMNGINWWVFVIPFVVMVLLISLSIYVYRAYRKFEMQEMDMIIHDIGSGRKVRKIKLGWMYLPLQTKEWLEKQAQKGLELERVVASIFIFRETGRKNIVYEMSFEPRVNSSFFAIHKELGWQLKYTSNITWLHYSIWAMPYEEGEQVPALTYDAVEKLRSIKKAFYMNVGFGVSIVCLSLNSIYINLFHMTDDFFEWSISGVLRILLIGGTVLWLALLTKIITGFRRELKMVKASST